MTAVITYVRLLVLPFALLMAVVGCNVLDEMDKGPRDRRAKTGDARCFDSFERAKAYMHKHGTSRQSGWQWHHIVGQHSANKAKFGGHDLHCSDNLVYVSRERHKKLNSYYMRKHDFTGGKRFYQWLSPMSFDEQYRRGQEVLRRFPETR